MPALRMEEMTSQDIKEAFGRGFKTVVIGIGSIEQHGPHLPIQTDALIGDAIANGVAGRLEGALQAPTIIVGCSKHHLAFSGTISYQESTLKAVIHDYVESLLRHGFTNIVLLTLHGGNFGPTRDVINELQKKYPWQKIIGYTDLMGFMDAMHRASKEFGITKEEAGAHAGETETSLVLALVEEQVIKDRFIAGYLGPVGGEEVEIVFKKGMGALTENGIIGDPAKATSEKGEFYLEKIVSFLVDEIRKMV